MSTQNTALQIADLDFLSIRENLKTFLQSQSEWDSYDFEGSGMAVLLDLLAYNTHYMAMNLNLIGNEMFIDSAQLRSSLLSHAKLLNYVPLSKVSAEAKVNILVTPGINESNTNPVLTLPRYTRFLSSPIDGVSYNFVNLNSNTTTQTANLTYVFSNVSIRQGEVMSFQQVMDQNNPKARFVLPSSNVDISSIRVSVQESISNTQTTSYIEYSDLTTLDANSFVYFVEENPDTQGTYTVYFGDGVLGNKPANGNIILIDYLDTLGNIPNKATDFTAVQGIGNYTANVIVTTVSKATGGSDRESNDEIRFKAPLYYSTQNRIVTKNDYNSILLNDYPNIQSISVWGGDENIPPVYGKVFISMQPVNNYSISDSDKIKITNEIIANRAVLTVFPEIVDPDYSYLSIRAIVYYNTSLTSLDSDEISSLVRQAIIDYQNNELTGFNAKFRKSRLMRYIDDAHKSITSSSIEVFAQKRFNIFANTNYNYTVDFGIPLSKGDATNKLYSYPQITVNDSLLVPRNCSIEEVPESYTGIDNILIVNAGQDYLTAPDVIITGDGTGANAVSKIINGKVSSIELLSGGINYTRATISLVGGDGSGATARAVLQNRNGTLRLFYYNNKGEKVIINNNIGTVDYDAGLINLFDLSIIAPVSNPLYDNTTLTLNIQPFNDTIESSRNQILNIDVNDSSSIQIEVIAES